MVFGTKSADLGRTVLHWAIAFHVSELLADVTLSHMDSVCDATSTKVDENLELESFYNIIDFQINLDYSHTGSVAARIFFNKEYVEYFIFLDEVFQGRIFVTNRLL